MLHGRSTLSYAEISDHLGFQVGKLRPTRALPATARNAFRDF